MRQEQIKINVITVLLSEPPSQHQFFMQELGDAENQELINAGCYVQFSAASGEVKKSFPMNNRNN